MECLLDQSVYDRIPKIDEYQYLCELNSYRVMLTRYGHDGMRYMNHGVALADGDVLHTGIFKVSLGSCKPLIRDYSDRIRYFLDDLAWEEIERKIARGIPVIVQVDVFCMPYKSYYQAQHGSHCVILDGFREGEYHVTDWYCPDYVRTWMPKETLNRARLSQGFQDPFHAFTESDIRAKWHYIEDCFEPVGPDEALWEVIAFSLKAMNGKGETGGLSFLPRMKEFIAYQDGLFDPGRFSNLLKSFFLMEMERKIHLYYLDHMIREVGLDTDLCCVARGAMDIIQSVKLLLIRAIKTRTLVPEEKWERLLDRLYDNAYETVLSYVDALKRMEGLGRETTA